MSRILSGGGASVVGGVHGRGMHGGGMCGRGACMAGGGACVAGETATAVDSTHPTGIHYCISIYFSGGPRIFQREGHQPLSLEQQPII